MSNTHNEFYLKEEIFRATPKKIVENGTKYQIPIYQRLFEWDKEAICRLLDDLYSTYEKSAGAEPYYIGMLTADDDKNLVDGQQRFTVATLMGVIFSMIYGDEAWRQFLIVGNETRLKFSAREEDAKFLSKIATDREFLKEVLSDRQCGEYVNKRMRAGLKAISEWKPQGGCEETFRDNAFSNYVFEQMSFFVTELPRNYAPKDMNRYFEAMNSLGRNLESHEMLEIDCLKHLPDCDHAYYNQVWNLVADMDTPLIRKINSKDARKRETEEEYTTRFLNLISLLKQSSSLEQIEKEIKRGDKSGLNDMNDANGSKPVEIGSVKANPDSKPSPRNHQGSHHSMLNFSEFLLQVLYLHQGIGIKEIKVDDFFDVHKLSDTFKGPLKKWNSDKNDCQKFFYDLLKYRLIYDYYIIRIPNSDGEDYDLALHTDENDKGEALLSKFQSMLYAGSASKSFYRWVVPLLEYLARNDSDCSPMGIYKFLIGVDKDMRKIDNMTVSASALRFDKGVSFYWFRRLDFILWKKIVIDDDFSWISTGIEKADIDRDVVNSMKFRRGGRSIEHLHPQNESDNNKWRDYNNVHDFGNLALISISFNSQQSNDNLDVKYGRIKQQIDSRQLQSIKLYLMYLASHKDGAEWTEEMMSKHQDEMISLLNEGLEDLNR